MTTGKGKKMTVAVVKKQKNKSGIMKLFNNSDDKYRRKSYKILKRRKKEEKDRILKDRGK